MNSKCRHCRKNVANRGKRGLCIRCYLTPGVRELYPRSAMPSARLGVPDRTGATPPPAKPTDAGPGTRSKVEVLAARAARGESLFHKADCDHLEGVAPAELTFEVKNDAPARKKKGSYKSRKKRKAA